MGSESTLDRGCGAFPWDRGRLARLNKCGPAAHLRAGRPRSQGDAGGPGKRRKCRLEHPQRRGRQAERDRRTFDDIRRVVGVGEHLDDRAAPLPAAAGSACPGRSSTSRGAESRFSSVAAAPARTFSGRKVSVPSPSRAPGGRASRPIDPSNTPFSARPGRKFCPPKNRAVATSTGRR